MVFFLVERVILNYTEQYWRKSLSNLEFDQIIGKGVCTLHEQVLWILNQFEFRLRIFYNKYIITFTHWTRMV